ncbi:MAG: bifunctional 3,4-dihydroxy-2-butanone-4-phosphate synthase/GTP cyclohydrolase II [Spirochaetales bacterium]|nr:bifunctional 3,4-dihydroxy-2-butanone-4-phosphate synthase/GTP cyclohydrolase II [Spirochaetales bacterium]
MDFISIEQAVKEIAEGKFVIVIDDEDRENEGDFIMAAEKVTPEAVNYMAKYGRGLICVPMTAERLRALDLPLMVSQNTEKMKTAFTVSVDAKTCTTGISAFERCDTIKALANPDSEPDDFMRPGHIFPLRAETGGVLKRAGHTEAAIDLARMAGLRPAGILCEIMNEDGTMARLRELKEFAKKHNLNMITIASLIEYRTKNEKLIKEVADTILPTAYGEFRLKAFESEIDKQCHLAIIKGDVAGKKDVLVRVHSECLTGDALGSMRCDCGPQLDKALEMIAEKGEGVVVYMRQEGRGIGLAHKLQAYALQDQGKDTVEANEALGFPADLRDYGIGAQILREIGLTTIHLLTNNPRKIAGLDGYNLKVTKRIPIIIEPGEKNAYYLKTKKVKLGHYLDIE